MSTVKPRLIRRVFDDGSMPKDSAPTYYHTHKGKQFSVRADSDAEAGWRFMAEHGIVVDDSELIAVEEFDSFCAE